MSLIDKALNAVGLQRKGLGLSLASGIESNPFALFAGSSKVSAHRAMQLYNGWVYACVRAIAEELARLRFRLYQINKDGVHEEIFDHELLDALNGVNQFQTGYELKYLTGSHLELTGNSYWFLDGVKSETDKPTAIYPLNPKYISIIKKPLPTFIEGYKYTLDTETKIFKPYQILHFKYPNPDDPYEGIGTVQAIIDWILADNYATEVNANYFKNGARLGGLLSSQNAITDAQMKVLRASFEAMYKGAGNAYKVAVLPKGVEYKEASENPKDMDFANLQAVMRDKILGGFRVPKTILGTAESETNRATAETANYVFAARTVKPKADLIIQYLNEFLVPRYGDNLYLDVDNPVPEDRQLRIEEMQAALGQQAAISVNEAREEYFGLDGIDNGDSVLTNFSSVPLGKPKAKELKINSRKGETKMPSVRFSKNAKKRKQISGDIADGVAKLVADNAAEFVKVLSKASKNITTLTDDEYEVLHKAFVNRVTPYQSKMADTVRKFNKDQKEVVIKNLDKIVKAVDKADLFDEEEWINILVDASSPTLKDLYAKEGKEALTLLGTAGEFVLTAEVQQAIVRSVRLMSSSYNATTLDALKRVLEQGQAEGLSLEELAHKVDDVYEVSDMSRAETVARTETFRIANDATREAWKQTGVVKSIKWYTAADERVCPYCAPMHGKTVAIEDNFFNKGDSIEGTDGTKLELNYADVTGGALHANCRCYTRPDEIVVNFDESKSEDGSIDSLIKEIESKA